MVAAGLLATGVARLLERIATPAWGLVWLIGGSALAASAWRSSYAALRRLHDAEEKGEPTEPNDARHIRYHPAGTIPAAFASVSAAATALE